MKRISVIGATGSVGNAVLDVIGRFKDEYSVSALAAKTNTDGLLELTRRFRPNVVCLAKPGPMDAERFLEEGAILLSGRDGLNEIATAEDVDNVVFASSGTDAVVALQQALLADKDVSLANKESVVAAGPWVMPLVQRQDQLRPVDSEHNAIWQCLRGEASETVRRLWLTASGGPFRETSLEELKQVTPEQALNHPTWRMGPKITIDSATLMNKGIECVEAMQLFSLPPEKVAALIHPASLVHGLVEFCDRTIKLVVSRPDMRLAAASALAYPDRLTLGDEFSAPDLAGTSLNFAEPDNERFPCLKLAIEAGRRGGAYPPLLIGADEYAVQAFLKRRIPFLYISNIIESTLERYTGSAPTTVEEAIGLISEGYRLAEEVSGKIGDVN